MRMAEITASAPTRPLLRGWPAIAAYCRWSQRSVQRYLRTGFPAHRWGRDMVASPDQIDRWLIEHERRQKAQHDRS
jgi:hypothetical protein